MRRLILSQIPNDFDKQKDILLGPFCLVGHENEFSDWESYIIEPDPFKTVLELKNATEYTAEYANSLLPYMREKLNEINNINKSIKFWRILILPWLLLHVQVLWERYLRVKNIVDKYSEQPLEIQIVSNKYKLHFENTFDYYYNGALNIYYNEWILSRLIEDNKLSNWLLKYVDKEPVKQPLPLRSWKRKLYNKYFMRLRCKDLVGANPIESIILSLALSMSRGDRANVPIKTAAHNEIKNYDYVRINRQLFSYIIKEIPECFKKIDLLNHPEPTPHPGKKRIVTSFDIFFNENNKKYLSHCVDGGEKIIPTQHGGYGTALFFTLPAEVEYHHDSLITWGWTKHSDYQCNFISKSSPFLSKFANRHKTKKNNLIFVGTIINIVSYGIEAVPQPLQQLNYIKEKISLIKNLNKPIYNNLLYRPYYRTHGTIDEDKLIKNIFPDITLLKGNLHREILGCKILVLDHPGTTLNIALAANIPTICYWDEKIFPLCEQVEPFFKTFKKAGILFLRGHEAALKVNEIWDDVETWWAQDDIQEARQDFCWNYARTNKFWLYEWVKMIFRI